MSRAALFSEERRRALKKKNNAFTCFSKYDLTFSTLDLALVFFVADALCLRLGLVAFMLLEQRSRFFFVGEVRNGN